MRELRCVFVVLAGAACVLAIPSSLMTDVKQAESRSTNKVKRAQEVIMFGNQQNRGGDGRNAYALPRTEKRGVELDDNVLAEAEVAAAEAATERSPGLYPVEEPRVLAQYEPEYAQAQRLKSEYFMDPTLSDLRSYYDLDERRKRETFRTPSKRSSRGLTLARAKRDLEDLDPQELLAFLAYWENERRNKNSRNMYNQYSTLDSDDLEMLDNPDVGNELGDEEEPRPDQWLDGPVPLPSRHFSVGAEPSWGRPRFSEDRRKRFMVSKRRSQDGGDMYSLAQLLNGPQPQREREAAPVFRRYVL